MLVRALGRVAAPRALRAGSQRRLMSTALRTPGAIASRAAVQSVARATAQAHVQSREYKVNCGDVKAGHVVEVDGKLYLVTGLHISQAAMRKSSMSLEMKDLKTGSKVPYRCKPSDKIERVELEKKHFTYLYRQGDILHLMAPETYEQLEVDAKILSDPKDAAYLRENSTITVEMRENAMLRVIMPLTVVAQVKQTDSNQVKGEGLKPAELTNGRQIRVSQHVQTGDWVKLHLADETFLEKTTAPTE